MKTTIIAVTIVVAVVGTVIFGLMTLVDKCNDSVLKAVVNEKRLLPEKQFVVEGKVENTMFNDGDVVVITVLPESTPEVKVRRVYVFSHYTLDDGQRFNQKTYCKRTFDMKETVK